MKMISKQTLLIFLCGFTLLVSSCKKDKKKETASSGLSTTTITGQVEYEVDYAHTGLELVPSGLIVAEINAWDLQDNPPTTGTSPKLFFNGNITNGIYSVNVSVGNRPISIKLYPQDFEDDKIVSSTLTVRTIYTASNTTVSGVPSGTKIVDFLYN